MQDNLIYGEIGFCYLQNDVFQDFWPQITLHRDGIRCRKGSSDNNPAQWQVIMTE